MSDDPSSALRAYARACVTQYPDHPLITILAISLDSALNRDSDAIGEIIDDLFEEIAHLTTVAWWERRH